MSCLTPMLHGPIYEGKHAETRSLVDNNNNNNRRGKTKNKTNILYGFKESKEIICILINIEK